MKKTVLIFGALIFALLLLFRIGKYAIITSSLDTEIVIAIVAIVFFLVGVFLNKKSLQNEKPPSKPVLNDRKIESLDISPREYEVLMEIASGLSNKEIAEKLFLSESTIKTHVSNLLVKLNAKRRTHAIQIAQEYGII